MMSTYFVNAFTEVLKQEGGWVFTDSANDPGGMTYGGMTYSTFTNYCRKIAKEFPSSEAFKNVALAPDGSQLRGILRSQIMDAYEYLFWDLNNLDNRMWDGWPKLAMFSCDVNTDKLVQIIQRMLGIAADGIMGEQTMNAINRFSGLNLPPIIEKKFKAAWRQWYVDLVIANINAWDTYTSALQAYLSDDSATISMAHITSLAPKYRRWKDLTGWLARVESC